MDKETIRQIKSDFFALRNGVIADKLRSAGCPYKIIFGLTVPQIESVAAKHEPSAGLAETLWANDSTRESRLMAKKWIADADTVELVDMLCFRLVRNVEGVEQLAFSLAGEEPTRYAGLRLLMNLLVVRKLADVEKAKGVASQWAEGGDAVARVARQIKEEIEWCF
mgnify:CR=1 FL=1